MVLGLTLTSLLSFSQSTVVDIIVDSPDHTLLEAAVIEANLAGALSDTSGSFTVFAPTDDAFVTLTTELGITADDLLALDELTNILLYHVVAATALSGDLMDGDTFETLYGDVVTVTLGDGTVMINNAMVTVADITADNGVVHVIDAVLLPPTEVETTTVVDVIVGSDDHTVLELALVQEGLVETLGGEGPFTVFAPTDTAFAVLAGLFDVEVVELLELQNFDRHSHLPRCWR